MYGPWDSVGSKGSVSEMQMEHSYDSNSHPPQPDQLQQKPYEDHHEYGDEDFPPEDILRLTYSQHSKSSKSKSSLKSKQSKVSKDSKISKKSSNSVKIKTPEVVSPVLTPKELTPSKKRSTDPNLDLSFPGDEDPEFLRLLHEVKANEAYLRLCCITDELGEAEKVEKKLKELKMQIALRKYGELDFMHKEEMLRLESVWQNEINKLNLTWKIRMESYKAETGIYKNHRVQTNQTTTKEFQDGIQAIELRPRQNTQLIGYQKLLHTLVRGRDFTEAKKVRVLCHGLQETELQKAQRERDNQTKIALKAMGKKHLSEIDVIDMKIEAGLIEMGRTKNVEMTTLNRKFTNMKKEIERAQHAERIRFEQIYKARFGIPHGEIFRHAKFIEQQNKKLAALSVSPVKTPKAKSKSDKTEKTPKKTNFVEYVYDMNGRRTRKDEEPRSRSQSKVAQNSKSKSRSDSRSRSKNNSKKSSPSPSKSKNGSKSRSRDNSPDFGGRVARSVTPSATPKVTKKTKKGSKSPKRPVTPTPKKVAISTPKRVSTATPNKKIRREVEIEDDIL